MVAVTRVMTKTDKPFVIEILNNTPEFKPSEILVAEEVLNDYLRNGTRSGYHVMVAEIDSTIAGYICFGQTPLTEATWDIYWLVTSPKFRRQGIGRTLLKSAEDEIIKANGKMIVVETSSKPEYDKAKSLYRSFGYQLTCQITDFYASGDDKVIMVKRLD